MQEFEKIKKIRTTLKLTQQEMADAIGVSKQYFSKVENGHTELSKEKAMVLCHEYDISLNWLLLDIGSMFANDVEKNAETFKTNVENILDANLNLLIFSSYIEKAFSIIKNIDNNASIKNIIKTARLVFIKDFSIRRLPLLEVKSALEKFENEVKDSEEFKTKILKEYYCVVIENQSEK